VTQEIKKLRHPISVTINGQPCTLLTSGYLAHAMNRTPWTIKYWQRIGLFPRAPFVLSPSTPARRSLFPEPFVKSLKAIAMKSYYGARLDRDDFQRFHDDVQAAYKETVRPLLQRGITEEMLAFAENVL
jgi:hypothetical protein